MTKNPNKDPLVFIEHVINNINNIELFMENVTKEYFFNNLEKQSAVFRQLEIIGEAIMNIPNEFRKKYPEVPWSDIAATRNKIIHHYFGINLDIIWNIINEDLPRLKKQIQEIFEKEK